jgi:hypothetical protein
MSARRTKGAAARTQNVRGKANDTFGPPELCTWRVDANLCRFQTTSSNFARKLAKRQPARLVAWGVNGFLRIFQEPMPLGRAVRLVERYLKAVNDTFLARNATASASETARSIKTAGRC